jgi:hypothetical protein
MTGFLRATLTIAILALSSVAALADDWVAVRLRGAVLQLVDGAWVKLNRGDVVPDSRVIRTLRSGNVEFQRGEERVTLGADTQIQIYDKARAKPFTTVKQYFGTVTVEAEVRDVQHFAVQTNYLAAVVKGTKFTVTAGDDGASVDVKRGAVFVQDSSTKNNVTVTAGETASVGKDGGKPAVSTSHDTSFANFFKRIKTDSIAANDDKPGKLKTDDGPSKPGKPDKDETPSSGKPGNDDKTNNGKSDDDNSGKGKPDTDDKTNNGKSDDDNSGKGKSDDDDSDKGKNDDDNSGKGKSDDGDDD